MVKNLSVFFLLLLCYTTVQSQRNEEQSALIEQIWGKGPNEPVSVTTNTPCECVPYYLCNNGTVNENGEDIIDIR